MATILSGDIQIDYLADNRQKRMSWLGGTKTEYTMNEVYSAMATLLDETTTIDSGTAFSAETPVEYTTGKIDSGDSEPWYITFDLMEHITNGALRTSGWLRVEGSNTGIVIVPVTSGGAIVAGDCGKDIVTDIDGDTGTLLEVIDTGGVIDYLVIRPDTDAAGNSFNNAPTAGGTMTCNGHQSTQDAASTTGEQIWTNLYSLGTIDPNVHLYLYQGEAADDADRTRIYSWNDNTQDWYGNGHIDICVALKDITAATWSIIDNGYITVFARKYGDLFASFEVECSTTSGGRNPLPLQTSADLDNTTGIKNITYTAGVGAFAVGDIILGATTGARGILTAVDAGTDLDYIPIDDPQVDFQAAENISAGATTGTNIGAPSSIGPAINTWFTNNTTPTIAFGFDVFDTDDDGANEDYGVTVNCQNNPLTEVYEWMKYATRNGEVTNDLDGINGERYIGGEVYLEYSGAVGVGTIDEGENVLQATSLATGVVVSHNTGTKILLLRDVRGTFDDSHTVTSQDVGAGTITPDTAAVTFAPKTASPLGTFAGGTYFGARGVLIENWVAADENSFQLTPIEGGTFERPQAISIEVTNLVGGLETSALHDRVSVFRLDGGNIKKTEYDCAGGENPGDSTITTTGAIAQDVPGKTTGGWIVLVDSPAGDGDEYKIRYSSWTGMTFTLANKAAFVSTGATAPTVVELAAGGFNAAVKRGDLVYNHDTTGFSYVKTVESDTKLTLEGSGIALQNVGDSIEINCVPINVLLGDDIYVPFMDKIATGSEESVSIIYVNPINFRVKVRNTRAVVKIKPYSSDGSTAGTDQSISVVRQEDTIIS
jgi:hypothetical protein